MYQNTLVARVKQQQREMITEGSRVLDWASVEIWFPVLWNDTQSFVVLIMITNAVGEMFLLEFWILVIFPWCEENIKDYRPVFISFLFSPSSFFMPTSLDSGCVIALRLLYVLHSAFHVKECLKLQRDIFLPLLDCGCCRSGNASAVLQQFSSGGVNWLLQMNLEKLFKHTK